MSEVSDRPFRHVLQNMYRKNLDREKLRNLQQRLPDIVGSWKSAREEFVESPRNTVRLRVLVRFAFRRDLR